MCQDAPQAPSGATRYPGDWPVVLRVPHLLVVRQRPEDYRLEARTYGERLPDSNLPGAAPGRRARNLARAAATPGSFCPDCCPNVGFQGTKARSRPHGHPASAALESSPWLCLAQPRSASRPRNTRQAWSQAATVTGRVETRPRYLRASIPNAGQPPARRARRCPRRAPRRCRRRELVRDHPAYWVRELIERAGRRLRQTVFRVGGDLIGDEGLLDGSPTPRQLHRTPRSRPA